MKHAEYHAHTRKFTQELLDITDAKNADYTAGTDEAMAGFYDLAEFAGVNPMQAYLVLLGKHIQAIRRFARVGNVKSESLHGRFTDVAVYAMLGDALAKDLQSNKVMRCAIEDDSPSEKRSSKRRSRQGSTATSAASGTRRRRSSYR